MYLNCNTPLFECGGNVTRVARYDDSEQDDASASLGTLVSALVLIARPPRAPKSIRPRRQCPKPAKMLAMSTGSHPSPAKVGTYRVKEIQPRGVDPRA